MDRLGPYLLGSNDGNQGIYTGDARILSDTIPDESVDIIITDPPYLREFLPLYGWLAKEAGRILKPGGWLFAYGAGEHLPTHLREMGKYLDYFWVYILLHTGGYPRMWHKRLMSGYKPVMVYTKGSPKINPWQSTVHRGRMDKRFHVWGQGIVFPLKMIDMLTNSGDVVFDPFTGGGTVPTTCKMLGRRWLAFEIDPEVADVARKRVRNTSASLGITVNPEHLTLW